MHCPQCWEKVAQGATICFACGAAIRPLPEAPSLAPKAAEGGGAAAGPAAPATEGAAGESAPTETGKPAPTEAERRADLAQAVRWFRQAIGRLAEETNADLTTVEARLQAARARLAELQAEVGIAPQKPA